MSNKPSEDDIMFLDLTEYNDIEGYENTDNILDLTTQYNDVSNYEDYRHEHTAVHNPYFEEYAAHHEVHPELDHDFDHWHDVHPFEYHEHAVLPAFDYGKKKNDFGDFERAAAKQEGEVMTHMPFHHHEDPYIDYGHHEIHRELDH